MEDLFGKAKIWLQVIIGIGYTLLGGYVIKEKWFLTTLDEKIAWVLGVILILYGIYRIYRAVKISKEEPL